jgi:hypothetical protein
LRSIRPASGDCASAATPHASQMHNFRMLYGRRMCGAGSCRQRVSEKLDHAGSLYLLPVAVAA